MNNYDSFNEDASFRVRKLRREEFLINRFRNSKYDDLVDGTWEVYICSSQCFGDYSFTGKFDRILRSHEVFVMIGQIGLEQLSLYIRRPTLKK